MAFPTIPTAAGNTLLSTATTTASTTHTFPDLTTLAPAAGDLIIAVCVQYQGGTSGGEFGTWGASLTEIADLATVTALDMAIGVAYKVASGGETGTFTVTSAHSFMSVQFLMRIPAGTWQGTTIPEVSTAVRATGAVADPPSLDPANWAAEDTLWISVYGHSETSTTGSPPTLDTAPTNYSGALIVARGADAVGNLTAGVAFRQVNATAEDAGVWGVSNPTRGNGIAAAIAVRPAAITYQKAGVATTGTKALGASALGVFPKTGTATTATKATGASEKTSPPVPGDATGNWHPEWRDVARSRGLSVEQVRRRFIRHRGLTGGYWFAQDFNALSIDATVYAVPAMASGMFAPLNLAVSVSISPDAMMAAGDLPAPAVTAFAAEITRTPATLTFDWALP